jgi:hypothetical protein
MALTFAALASVATLLIVLSTAITYITVVLLDLPFAAVLVAMAVVGVLNAVLRTAVLSNFEEVRGASVKHPAYAVAGATPEEIATLFVAYLITALVQFLLLRSRFNLQERTTIVIVTGASNILFRNLL